MTRYAEPMARLIEELKKLPGVGTKSAQRFAFHILRSSDEDAAALAEAVRGLKASLRLCSICNNVTDVDPCAYCASPTRNQRLVCVVEEPTSIAAVERTRPKAATRASITCCTGPFRPCTAWGRTSCAPARWSPAWNAARWTRSSWPPAPRWRAKPPPTGWPPRCAGLQVRITRIATGVPAGSDIEYADEVTMARALEGRREL